MTCSAPCPTCIGPGVITRPGSVGTCDRACGHPAEHSHFFYDDSPDVKSVVEHKWTRQPTGFK